MDLYNQMMPNFYGVKIVEDPNLLVKQKRTWHERLFTRPWQPFKSYRMVPDTKIYSGMGTFVMHPSMKQKFLESMREQENARIHNRKY